MSANFEALLKELGEVAADADTLAKAIPAAAPPAMAAAGVNPEDDDDDDEDGDDAVIESAAAADGDKPTFGKSFEFVDDAGANTKPWMPPRC